MSLMRMLLKGISQKLSISSNQNPGFGLFSVLAGCLFCTLLCCCEFSLRSIFAGMIDPWSNGGLEAVGTAYVT